MDVSARLTRRVLGQFREADAERVLSELRDLPASTLGRRDPEWIQAALVIRAGGDWQAFQSMLRLAQQDWRDLLVAADLGHGELASRAGRGARDDGPACLSADSR